MTKKITQVSKAADQSIAFPWKPCVNRGEDQGKHPRRPWPGRTASCLNSGGGRKLTNLTKKTWENYGKPRGWRVFISPVQLKQYKVLLSKWRHDFFPKFLGWKWSKTKMTCWWITHILKSHYGRWTWAEIASGTPKAWHDLARSTPLLQGICGAMSQQNHHSSLIVPPIHDGSSSASLMRKLFLHVVITFKLFAMSIHWKTCYPPWN